jgi:CotH kinase protein
MIGSGKRLERALHLAGTTILGSCAIAACSSSPSHHSGSRPTATETRPTTPPSTAEPPNPSPGVDSPQDRAPQYLALYEPDIVPQFELILDAPAVAVLSSPNAADEKTWVHGSFKFGEITFDDVGVRRKGSSTFRSLPQKASLKIKFNKYVKGQKLHGLEELTLNNDVSDHTYLAQRLAYHVFRSLGLPAQLANSAQLRINGENYGLYTNVETPNDSFLARVFGSKAKTLYEASGGGGWLPGAGIDWQVNVADPNAAPGTTPDLDSLFRTVAAANDATLLTDLEAHLHTQRFLRYCAAEAITSQNDGYAYSLYDYFDNYFMAGDTDGKFSLIPWSLDRTFVDGSGDDVNVARPHADSVLSRCSRSATCWDAYKAEVQAALGVYETLDLVNVAKNWHNGIDAFARADPKREFDVGLYDSLTLRTYDWIAARATTVRTQLGL